ncbi:MAG TPA: glycoside hydrolase family 66 protein, partial [Candidatus Limnocylindrales bacterium]|nr:glycoside hydrolase family 66 protein [Candidatus Limnocylindrales bacterium]
MIYPDRAFYLPGEFVHIAVSGPFRATIWHLADCVVELEGCDVLCWSPPPETQRGYRVRVETGSGVEWTAFDVLDCWTDAPRYGYLFDFTPGRASFDLDSLLALHVNGLQFYDWLYRHDTLLPPFDEFEDPLGRPQSLATVRRLIDEAHARGMAAMPYTAIYAASPPFAAAHPEWGLFDASGVLYDFADGFLKYTNPASGWSAHLANECAGVLKALPFDGVHLDQYGEPQSGFDAAGHAVELPAALRGAIEQVRDAIPPGKA